MSGSKFALTLSVCGLLISTGDCDSNPRIACCTCAEFDLFGLAK